MKILIATDIYYPSVNGLAYFICWLGKALTKRGHEVFVMCPSQSFKNTISNEDGVTVYGIRSIHIPVYKNFRVPPPFISKKVILRAVGEISPDIVHVQTHFTIGGDAAIAARERGIPVIGTNHSMPENISHYLHLPKIAERRLHEFLWKRCIRIFEQLDSVTTPTKTAAALLKKEGFGKDIIPISCGIDLERFKTGNSGAYLKQIYAIPEHKPVLLHVGRLDEEKRVEVILRSLPDILHTVDVHLVLAGIGKEKQKLEKLTQELGIQKAVTFTGFVLDKDLQNIYGIADLFVIAGIAELQSIATLEAMASGLPVVAVDAVALPELVHDGKNGYLFSCDDSKMLAEKVLAILSDPALRARMSKESLEIIKAHDINKTIDKYESLYQEMLNR